MRAPDIALAAGLAAVMTLAASTAGFAARDKEGAQDQLKSIKQEMGEAAARKKQLEQQAAALRLEEKKLSSALVEAAARTRDHEARIQGLEDDLAVLVEGDRRMFNPYGVMVVNPAKHPHVKAALAQGFVDWVVSPAGQAVIADYKIGGEQLFFPNAGS